MKIKEDEKEIIGKWTFENGKVHADSSCERIEWLVRHSLTKVAATNGGWEILYKDNETNRYWEFSYPKSSWQGSGPPCLKEINSDTVNSKYLH